MKKFGALQINIFERFLFSAKCFFKSAPVILDRIFIRFIEINKKWHRRLAAVGLFLQYWLSGVAALNQHDGCDPKTGQRRSVGGVAAADSKIHAFLFNAFVFCLAHLFQGAT